MAKESRPSKPTTKEVARKVYAAAEGYPLLGWLVSWSTGDFMITIDEFAQRLQQCGIDPSYARPVLAKNAAIRAGRVKKKEFGKNALYRKVEEEDKTTIVVASLRNNSTGVEFDKHLDPYFDKKTKSIQGHNADELKPIFEELKTKYSSSQFRTVVLRFLRREAAAISMKDTGGIYLIPASKEDSLRRLEKLFEATPGSKLMVIPQVDTSRARTELWNLMMEEVNHEVEVFEKELNELGEVTEKQSDTRLDRYVKLREKIEIYETVLSGTAQEMKSKLSSLSDNVRKKIIAI